jgi:outer membrane receptor protein involved in Fe transport
LLVKPLNRLSVVLLLVALLASTALAGTTGKIAGTVIDKQTGEPLPGVNVVIAGTTIGAATNIQGEFFIINVPPGKYTLKINLIGYRPMEITNVEVTIDLTTKVDLDLETETIDMGTITVEAERPLIEPDVTSTRMRITPDEITGSAVNGLVARVGVGAGNVLGSFRGSRDGTGEVVYLLDGVNMANPLGTYSGILPGSGPSTELAAYIPDESIAEAEVLTGGFGAEYPSVQSAVINVVAKEGGKNFAGKFRSKSSTDAIFGWDIYGNPHYDEYGTVIYLQANKDSLGNVESWDWLDNPQVDKYDRSKIYDQRQHDWSFSGPVPLKNLDIPGEMNFSTSGTYQFNRDTRSYDFWRKTHSIQGKLSYQLSSSKKLTISGLTSKSDYVAYDFSCKPVLTWGKTWNITGPVYWPAAEGAERYYRPDTIPAGSEPYYVIAPDGGLDSVYSFTPYGWIVAQGHTNAEIDSIFFYILNNSLGLTPDSADYFVEHPSGEYSDIDINGVSLLGAVGAAADSIEARGIGRTYTNYNTYNSSLRQNGSSDEVAINFTNNLSPRSFYNVIFSRFSTGKTSRQYDPWDDHPLTYDEMLETRFVTMGATQFQQLFFVNPMFLNRRRVGDDEQIVYTAKGDLTTQVNSTNLMKMGFELKKYDLYKNHTSIASGGNEYNDQFHTKPLQLGAYAQNKLESEGMILNIGLRYDFFDPKTYVPSNPEDPLLQEYIDDPQNIDAFDYIARIKGAVKAKTKQQLSPRVGVSYPITEFDVLHVTYGHYFQLPELYYLYENLAYDLRGAHKYMGNPDLKAEKTISYEAGLEHGFNDFLKLSVTGFYKDISNLVTYHKTYFGNAFYWRYSNSDYARVKGFELALTQRPWHGFSGVVTYTYQIARGRASDGYQTFQDDYDNRKPRTEDFPLDWDQRHTANANLNYHVPADWGPMISNYHFLGDWGIDLFFQYGSGTPYSSTISVPQPELPPMNDKTFPEAWRIDMRFDKSFKIYKTYKTNFFVEVRNLTNRANIVNEYAEFDAERYDLTGEPGGQFQDPDVYNAPRRIMLGFEMLF